MSRQIWFQNRRQNDRRRSKPIQPDDLASHANPVTSKDGDKEGVCSCRDSTSQSNPCPLNHDTNYATSPPSSSEPSNSSQCDHIQSSPQLDSSQVTTGSQQTQLSETPTNCSYCSTRHEPKEDTQLSSGKRKRSDIESQGLGLTTGSPGRRRSFVPGNPPSLRISLSSDGKAMVRGEDESTPSPQKPRDSLRISFSADGEAVVRTGNEPSPSRNRMSTLLARQSRFGALRRTNSAISLGSMKERDTVNRKLFGRSRDSRMWELYCDTDARSALSPSNLAPASETRRPSSAKKVMQKPRASDGDRRASGQRPDPTNAVASSEPPQKRKKLSRTMSSLGRLETPMKAASTGNAKMGATSGAQEAPKPKSKLHIYNGDSDKENWIPGTQSSSVRRRRGHPARSQQRALQSSEASRREGNQALSAKHKGSRTMSRKQVNHGRTNMAHLSDDENVGASKIGTGSAPNETEDLDCVQGLLSLSQGAWR